MMSLSRPHVSVNPSAIPAELRNIPQWVCWKYLPAQNGDKPRKLPINPKTGDAASISDRDTWTDFHTALQALERNPDYAGLWLALTPELGIVAWDFDDTIDDENRVPDWLTEVLRELASYTELSPSGRGIRVLCYGKLPEGARNRTTYQGVTVEVYDRARFISLTGNTVKRLPHTIEHRQTAIESVYRKLLGEPKPTNTPAAAPAPTSALDLSDAELLAKAFSAENGEKFRALWYGDDAGYPSPSEADMALMSWLRFWTGGDPERMLRLFNMSARAQREKWQTRPDYQQRTLQAALAAGGEVYKPRNNERKVDAKRQPSTHAENNRNGDTPRTEYDDPERLAPSVNWTQFVSPLVDTDEAQTEWLFPNLVARGELTILAGEAGAGKTTLAMELAYALTTGGEFLGEKLPTYGRVLWLHYDHDAKRLREKYGWTFCEDPDRKFLVANFHQLEQAGVEKLTPDNVAVWAEIIRANQIDLLVVDTLSDWTNCDDTDKASKVLPFMNAVRQLIETTGVAVLAIHHPNKVAALRKPSSLANSYVFGAKADTIALLAEADPNDDRSVTLRVVKCRSGERWEATYTKQGGRFIPVSADQRPRTPAELIIDAVAKLGKCTRDDLLEALKHQMSERTLRRHLERLVRNGKLKLTRGGYNNRVLHYTLMDSDPDPDPNGNTPNQCGHSGNNNDHIDHIVHNELSYNSSNNSQEQVQNQCGQCVHNDDHIDHIVHNELSYNPSNNSQDHAQNQCGQCVHNDDQIDHIVHNEFSYKSGSVENQDSLISNDDHIDHIVHIDNVETGQECVHSEQHTAPAPAGDYQNCKITHCGQCGQSGQCVNTDCPHCIDHIALECVDYQNCKITHCGQCGQSGQCVNTDCPHCSASAAVVDASADTSPQCALPFDDLPPTPPPEPASFEQFVRECQLRVSSDEADPLTVEELYYAYCVWARSRGLAPQAAESFGRWLLDAGYKLHRERGMLVCTDLYVHPKYLV